MPGSFANSNHQTGPDELTDEYPYNPASCDTARLRVLSLCHRPYIAHAQIISLPSGSP